MKKNIIVSVTGGIAAYKAAILIRLLIRKGANVKVLMTPFAKHFVNPLTYSTLSKNPVITEFYNPENGDWNSHVDLGLWADAMIIAPATANTMGKAANGIADNLLLTSYLSARCPVFWAPAMDLDMYKHASVQKNINTLKTFGNHIIEAETGELASGLDGKGRMAEPENIVNYIENFFSKDKLLKGKKALITAGSTQENIDPVRFIGNRSTGKMGYAIAEELAENGADVTLISGNATVDTENKSIKVIKIRSAEEMYHESKKYFVNCDISVFAAAVADYKPVKQAEEKIKKLSKNTTLQLEKTIDIAAELGKVKTKNQINIGFALETENENENAVKKIKTKNFDFIVLNTLKDKGAGFGCDTNKITIIHKNNKQESFELKTKKEVAKDIVSTIIKKY